MEALLHFAFWAGLIFLMMRFGCGAHVIGTDPVCGKTVMTDKAKPSVYTGNVYFFCSRECREVFEAAPDLYVDGGDPNHPKLEHSHT